MAVAGILNNRIQAFCPNGAFAFQLELSDPSECLPYTALGFDGRLAVSGIKNYHA